jgi:hypothetical protein
MTIPENKVDGHASEPGLTHSGITLTSHFYKFGRLWHVSWQCIARDISKSAADNSREKG